MLFSSKKTVGVIGLGIIGTRVAQNLRTAGHTVYVYSRSPRPVPNFLGSPAQMAEHCTFIQLFVRDSADLVEVMERLAQGPLGSRHVVINSATVSAEAVERAAVIAAERGAEFLNAPFMGSKAAAEKGALIYFAGGEEATLKRAQAILSASAREIIPAGTLRQAATMKLAANMLVALQITGLAEVLGFVERGGIDPERFLKALEPTVARSPLMEMKAPGILARDYEPHFSMGNMLKDARLAAEAAKKLGQEIPLNGAVAEILARGVEQGMGDLDFSAVAKLFLPSQSVPAAEKSQLEAIRKPDEIEAEEKPVESAPEVKKEETPRKVLAEVVEPEKAEAPAKMPASMPPPPGGPARLPVPAERPASLPMPGPDFDAIPRPGDPPRISGAPLSGTNSSVLERGVRASPLARRITPAPRKVDDEKPQMDLPLAPAATERPKEGSGKPGAAAADPSFSFTEDDVSSLPPEAGSPLVATKPVFPDARKLRQKESPFVLLRPRKPEDEDPGA